MPTFASARPRTARIVAIRSPGGARIVAYQLRVDGGGAGNSAYFPALRYGSAQAALDAALAVSRALGLPERTNSTSYAGIRFVWRPGKGGPQTLCVFASWIEPDGRKCTTSYSVERWGLDNALDRAIAQRTSSGAAAPDRVALLGALLREYRRGLKGSMRTV